MRWRAATTSALGIEILSHVIQAAFTQRGLQRVRVPVTNFPTSVAAERFKKFYKYCGTGSVIM